MLCVFKLLFRSRKKSRIDANKAKQNSGYVIHVWGPEAETKLGIIEIIFAVAGVELTVSRSEVGSSPPTFSCPVLGSPVVTGPDGYTCSQLIAIVSSLGKKFDLYPTEVNRCCITSCHVLCFV
jgi:hypothetical protein